MRNSLLYIPSSQEPISPLSFEGEFFFFRFSQSAVECKLANILHLAFSEKTPYLLWHTCLQGSCLCHRIFTAISDAMEPLAHVLCCTRVMECQWKQEPISTHLPCRNPKMLVVSSQTWKSKKERTQNLQTMVRRTSIFRQCYALIVIAVEKFFYTGSCCSHNWDFLWAVSLLKEGNFPPSLLAQLPSTALLSFIISKGSSWRIFFLMSRIFRRRKLGIKSPQVSRWRWVAKSFER